MTQPIDFVIAWVDGSDPAWRQEKNRYLHPGEEVQTDASDTRYRDWNNLHYWFRAVEAYAPWVNRVHLLTWGHTPAWLNLDAPKLNVVRHSDFIPAEYLPTFCSRPIELNMHRIPGLSEQFVYFNDDFFLTAPVQPEDFFVNGLPCDSLEETPLSFGQHYLTNSAEMNNVIFMSRNFTRQGCRKAHPDKWFSLRDPHALVKNLMFSILNDRNFFGMNIHHLPQSYLKRSLEAVWELEPELMETTCSHRFRNEGDVNQFAVKFWQLCSGNFHPYNKRKYGKYLSAGDGLEEICQIIRQQRYKALCINDSERVDLQQAEKLVNDAFQSVLPNKSSFEL